MQKRIAHMGSLERRLGTHMLSVRHMPHVTQPQHAELVTIVRSADEAMGPQLPLDCVLCCEIGTHT
jgi:hypothetical protein